MHKRVCKWKPSDICRSLVQIYKDFVGLSICDTTTARQLFVCFRSDQGVGIPRFYKGFKHVYVFGVSERKGKQAIVQTEMLVNYGLMGVVWLEKPTVENYLKVLDKMGVTVIKTEIIPKWNQIQILPRLNPLNCVELTKLMLGVKLWGVYTPNSLFKALLKRKDCKLILKQKET